MDMEGLRLVDFGELPDDERMLLTTVATILNGCSHHQVMTVLLTLVSDVLADTVSDEKQLDHVLERINASIRTGWLQYQALRAAQMH